MMRIKNGFDQLRLFAALVVLFSHSFPFARLVEPTVFGDTLGRLAVLVFFALSGYLVCTSWQRDQHAGRFMLRRMVRIFPGLVVAVLVTTFMIGLAVTTLSATEFLSSRQTWAYVVSNALGIAGVLSLPGVFEGPANPIFNDSLWTLRYEILMYVVLMLLGLSGRLRVMCILLAAACGATTLMFAFQGINHQPAPIPVLWKLGLSFDFVWLARFGTVFFGAASLALLPRLKYSWAVGFLLAALIYACPAGRVQGAVAALALPYILMLVAFRAPEIIRGHLPVDLSYGIYIYAYPVQQILSRIALKHGYGWEMSLAASVAVIGILALASWCWVEKPAMQLKPRRPAAEPSPSADVSRSVG